VGAGHVDQDARPAARQERGQVEGLGRTQRVPGVPEVDADRDLVERHILHSELGKPVDSLAPQLLSKLAGPGQMAEGRGGVALAGGDEGAQQSQAAAEGQRVRIADVGEASQRGQRCPGSLFGQAMLLRIQEHRCKPVRRGGGEQQVACLLRGAHGTVGCDPGRHRLAELGQRGRAGLVGDGGELVDVGLQARRGRPDCRFDAGEQNREHGRQLAEALGLGQSARLLRQHLQISQRQRGAVAEHGAQGVRAREDDPQRVGGRRPAG
jgi:hypothetical protein